MRFDVSTLDDVKADTNQSPGGRKSITDLIQLIGSTRPKFDV